MNTMNDVERAEMMLSLGMSEDGEPLSDEARATLEQFIQDNSQPHAVEIHNAAPDVTGTPTDIQAIIQNEIAKALGGQQQQAVSLEDVLKGIDPRDSEAALMLFDWLCNNDRIGIVGTLHGGGYLLHYTEPKGTTKAGYTPGGTQGGRMVDEAVAKAKESGAKPRKVGICDKCWSAVEQKDDGTIVADDGNTTCAQGGTHNFNA